MIKFTIHPTVTSLLLTAISLFIMVMRANFHSINRWVLIFFSHQTPFSYSLIYILSFSLKKSSKAFFLMDAIYFFLAIFILVIGVLLYSTHWVLIGLILILLIEIMVLIVLREHVAEWEMARGRWSCIVFVMYYFD